MKGVDLITHIINITVIIYGFRGLVFADYEKANRLTTPLGWVIPFLNSTMRKNELELLKVWSFECRGIL